MSRPTVRSPSLAASSAAARSAALAYRCAGSTAKHRSTIAATGAGTSLGSGSGGVVSRASAVLMSVSPWNGSRPVSIS